MSVTTSHQLLIAACVVLPLLWSCGGNSPDNGVGDEGAASPQAAARQLFNGIDVGDQNEFLDVVDPTLRGDPANSLLFSRFSLGLFGVGVSTTASDIDFRGVTTRLVSESGDWADVAISGRLRHLGTEQPFDEVIVTRRVSGRWYVSNEEQRSAVAATETAGATADARAGEGRDLQRLLGEIREYARQTGLGTKVGVLVDSTNGTPPWYVSLGEFSNSSYATMERCCFLPPPEAVVFVQQRSLGSFDPAKTTTVYRSIELDALGGVLFVPIGVR